MRWWLGLLPVICALPATAAAPEFTLEQFPVAGGAQIITIFGHLPGSSSVPLVSVLRDTLGDSDTVNDRLRYVWVLTSVQPTIPQRITGAIPFFYWRPDLGRKSGAGDHPKGPAPVFDMGAASRHVWSALAGSMLQVLALDPEGMLIRSSTRRYRINLEDQRRVHLLEGLAVVSQLAAASQTGDEPQQTLLSQQDLLNIETRLTLAGKMLGGLLPADKLPSAYIKERTRIEEMRAHNWDLLRQRAEANGLYFEPFGLNGSSTHALLWIASDDIDSDRKFDGKFLGISNPYRDARLQNWTGYREVRDGREMIPLALYALEYPKVPVDSSAGGLRAIIAFIAPSVSRMALRSNGFTRTSRIPERMISRRSLGSNWPWIATIGTPSASFSRRLTISCAFSTFSKLRKTASGASARSVRARSRALGYCSSLREMAAWPVAATAASRRSAISWSGQIRML